METLRAADASLLNQFQEVTAETVGAETETGRMLMAGSAEAARGDTTAYRPKVRSRKA
jgi:hypothetical protein